MGRIVTVKDLDSRIASCTKEFGSKLDGKKGKVTLCVCGGTGCLANSSSDIKTELINYIAEKGLQDKIEVNIVGCFGFCSQGPFVKVLPSDTLYRAVKVSDAKRIVDSIEADEILEDLLYVDPQTHEKVVKQEDINFYKKQVRVALHGCSIIDPTNLDEALGFEGFQAL